MSKYSVGIYSTIPAAWRPDASSALQAEIDGWAAPVQASRADGNRVTATGTQMDKLFPPGRQLTSSAQKRRPQWRNR